MRLRTLGALTAVLAGCGGKTPQVVLDGGALAACPDSPNCVSSQAEPTDEQHYIAPFAWSDGGPDAAAIAAWMGGQKRCTVLDQGDDWVHAACKTALMRFTDDVAFVLAPDEGVVHVRSASRVGHSDLGVNRKRVEALRAEWASGLPLR